MSKLEAAKQWLGTRWILHPKSTFDARSWYDRRALCLIKYLRESNAV
jgi:hypothetical protein